MKLYIWRSPYVVSYGDSYAIAIANSVEEARQAIRAGKINEYGFGGGKPVPSDIDLDRIPDAIHEGPFGEVYEWSE